MMCLMVYFLWRNKKNDTRVFLLAMFWIAAFVAGYVVRGLFLKNDMLTMRLLSDRRRRKR